MADEEKNEQAQEEQTEENAPEAEENVPDAEEAPDAEESAPEAEAEAPATDEPLAEEAPDDLEGLDWKTRQRLERSRRSGEAGPQRSADERATERTRRRSLAARGRSSYRKKQRGKGGRGEGTPPAERRSAGRKVRQGRVVSNKPDKTITVQIDVVRRHTSYEKIIRHSSTLHAHDERNEANQGDLVRVVETRPLSRTKRWRLVQVLEKAK